MAAAMSFFMGQSFEVGIIRRRPLTARLSDAEAILRRAAWRLVPLILAMYVAAFLNRVNVGFAALTMNKDLGFSPEIYGLGAGIFFFGYFIFEVPSNLMLEKVG